MLSNPQTQRLSDTGEFVRSLEDSISLGAGTLASGQNLIAGTVLALVAAAGTATQSYSGTGNGVMTLDATAPVQGLGRAGKYTVTCITAAANGGTFRVEDPQGLVLGDVAVGATFADHIKFSIADGSTDFVVGDKFTVTVTAESTKYTQLNLSGTDGSQFPAGVLFQATDATSADQLTTVVQRLAELNANHLTWPAGITAAQKAAAISQLADRNIIVRS